mmetsp:Transcript_84795/g.245176  ORF Transcript_84795/g.245176 Transcript_84795/m.245176 type:complete len:478 (-) Transcript_84795:108-1541(-)
MPCVHGDEDSSSSETEGRRSTELSVLGSNNVMVTAGLIVADVVGAGVLGMPRAVACFGWALGIVVLLICLAANVHISLLMWKVYMNCKTCADARTYIDLCAGAFARAPPWQRRLAVWTTSTSQYIFIFSMMAIFVLSAGKGLGMLFFDNHICLPKWAALACLLVLPFLLSSQRMGSYDTLVWINILTLIGTITIPLAYYIVNGSEEARSLNSKWLAVADVTVSTAASGFSTFIYAMTSQIMLTEIIAEMRDPAQLPKAYVMVSAPFQLACFLVAGLGGYYFLGDQVTGMFTENLPFNMGLKLGGLCLLTHMLISCFLKGVVFSHSSTTCVCGPPEVQHASVRVPWPRWIAISLASLFLAWFLANLVPFFADFVDLLGATLAPISCFVGPILMFARYYYDEGEHRPYVSGFEWACIAAELALALALMVIGTYTSAQNLLQHWESYGYPFECHCENMWRTCECSGEHVGMQHCINIVVS